MHERHHFKPNTTTAIDQLQAEAKVTESPEVRRRITALLPLGNETKLSGELLRSSRAVEVLEQIRTPEARKVLANLATGTSGAVLTRDAAGAIHRLNDRK